MARKLKFGTKALRDRVRKALGVVKAPRRPPGTPPPPARVALPPAAMAEMFSPPPIFSEGPRPVEEMLSPKRPPTLQRTRTMDSELTWAAHMRACTPLRPSSLRPALRSARLARTLRRPPPAAVSGREGTRGKRADAATRAATIDAMVSATMGLRRVPESDAPWDVSSRMLRQRVEKEIAPMHRRSHAKASTRGPSPRRTRASHGDEGTFNAAAASAAAARRVRNVRRRVRPGTATNAHQRARQSARLLTLPQKVQLGPSRWNGARPSRGAARQRRGAPSQSAAMSARVARRAPPLETTIDLSAAFTLTEVLSFADDADERHAARVLRTPSTHQLGSAGAGAHDRENYVRANEPATAVRSVGADTRRKQMAATVIKPRRRQQPTPRRGGAIAAARASRCAVDNVPVFSFALS